MEEIYKQLGITTTFEFAIVYASLLWVRLLTIFAIVPFLFAKPVPAKMRIGASMVIMFFLFPLLKPADMPSIPEDHLVIFSLYLKEAFVGLSIGFAASMIFYGFDAAGNMVDNQRGASIARSLIPQLGTQSSLTGQLLFQMGIVLYLIFGGHILFLQAICDSYVLIPIFQFPHIAPGLWPMMDFFISLSAEVLVLAVQLAAPVIIAILVADIVLGLTNRLAPQINVWELGFNIRGFIGILALFFSFTIIGREIHKFTMSSVNSSNTVIQLFSGAMPEELKGIETPPELKNIFEPTGEKIKTPSAWDTTIKAIRGAKAEEQ